MIRNRQRIAFTLAALAGLFSTASAADWYLQANHGLSDNWHTLADWWSQPSGGGVNPTSISSSDTFHTNGYQLRTPGGSAATTFDGGALVLGGGSVLVKVSGTSGNPVVIPAMLFKGGASRTFSNGSSGVQHIDIGELMTTRNEVTTFNTAATNRGFDIDITTLHGDGDINFAGGGTVDLTIADGSGFYGTIYVTGSTTLTVSGDIAIKGNVIVENGSDVVLNGDLSASFASVGGTINNTDRFWGLLKSGTALAANTTHTSAALQAAHPAFFTGGAGDLVVGRSTLVVDAGNVINNVGVGQLGMNLSAGKFWTSTSPNYQQDLKILKPGMLRTSVYPDKGFSLLDMDIRVAQILNAGGIPLFVGPITKPNPPFNTEQQHFHDNFLDLNGNTGSGTIATNITYLVQRYMAPPFNLTTQYWEVGNEPDISIDYQVASPQEYVDIYQSVHNALVAVGVRENVVLAGPVTAFEYGFAANGNRSDNIMEAFLEQTGSPLNGHRQVDVVTRHLYAEIYDWETGSPDPVENAYNLLNHPTEQVSFSTAHIQPWTYRGESAIQKLMRDHGHPADVGTGITEFNVPLQFRHTITQGLWFLTYDHFGLYNPANVLGSGFAFDIKTNSAMHYYSGGLPNHAWWATYVHNRLTGHEILEQHSSDSHLLVTATRDERYVYVQVLNRNDADVTATLDILNAPVAASTDAEMFVMSATELPDVLVPTSLGTTFSYTFPALTTRVFRYLRSDAPAVEPPPAPPTDNVVLDTDFSSAPTGMTTYHDGGFQPAIVNGDLKLINNASYLTTAVVFNGQPLAASQKRMRAEFVYQMTNGHYGSGFVFAAYSADPGDHGSVTDGLGFHGQSNVLFGVKREVKGTTPEEIAITIGDVTPNVDGFASQPLPNYPAGYNTDMFVVVDYDGDAGTVRVRLYEGSDDTGTLAADIINRVGVPASLPAGTVFGFTSSTADFAQINWIRELKITTDNGAGSTATPGSTFTLQSWTGSPWYAASFATTFSGGFAPDGTPVTLTFANAKTGVDVTTDPSAPDFTNAGNSYFGFEYSGFGVGDPTTGRFNRGESFTLTSTHDFVLQEINWREHNGDEVLHIQWTEGGSTQQQLFNITSDPQVFSGIHADANTPVVITNVSPASSPLSGRLRFEQIHTALLQ